MISSGYVDSEMYSSSLLIFGNQEQKAMYANIQGSR